MSYSESPLNSASVQCISSSLWVYLNLQKIKSAQIGQNPSVPIFRKIRDFQNYLVTRYLMVCGSSRYLGHKLSRNWFENRQFWELSRVGFIPVHGNLLQGTFKPLRLKINWCHIQNPHWILLPVNVFQVAYGPF